MTFFSTIYYVDTEEGILLKLESALVPIQDVSEEKAYVFESSLFSD
jgi:hypothetical protein